MKAVAAEGAEEEAEGFLDSKELLKRLPISPGTLENYRRSGRIPYIQLERRILYFWPNVKAALLRMQRGAQ